MDPHVLMDQIAFVFQNSRLFKTSILENVRAARPRGHPGAGARRPHGRPVRRHSGKAAKGHGHRDRHRGDLPLRRRAAAVALARAILKDAPIVVLDEATAFADPENEALIQKAFAELTQGRTGHHDRPPPVHRGGGGQDPGLERGAHSGAGHARELTAAGGLYAGCGRTTTGRSSGRSPANGEKGEGNVQQSVSAQIRPDRPGPENTKSGAFWTVVTNLVVMGGMGILYLLMGALWAP